jgi:hypothetical protein
MANILVTIFIGLLERVSECARSYGHEDVVFHAPKFPPTLQKTKEVKCRMHLFYMHHYHSLPISKCGLVYAVRNPSTNDAPKHPNADP